MQTKPSTIENIDTGLYNWVSGLNLATVTNEGTKKPYVIWLGTERAFQIKNNKELRDSVGKLKLPLITVNRDSITKDPNFKGSFQANVFETNDYRGGARSVGKDIQQEKTRNFKNADVSRVQDGNETGKMESNKVVYEYSRAPIPTYVTMMYTIVLRTEYQQQMNDLLTPFITTTGQINSFVFEQEGWKYEAFIQQEFAENKNVDNLGEDERMFETKIQIKVLGYLVGEGFNRERPNVIKRQNTTQIRIIREKVIVGDKRPWLNPDKFDFKE